jgi:hypothetical protein
MPPRTPEGNQVSERTVFEEGAKEQMKGFAVRVMDACAANGYIGRRRFAELSKQIGS